MQLFHSKRAKDLETYRDITEDVEEADFVPYACHYNAHTLITKNGELLQTIKILGLTHEYLSHAEVDLRETIRAAIHKHVPSDKYAIWFHTLRQSLDLSAEGEFSMPFARELSEAWEEKNRFSEQFGNEVYVTIVHEGQDASILDRRNFLNGLSPSRDIGWRQNYIDRVDGELNIVVERVLETLKMFGAKRLSVVKREAGYYSELSEFLERLINLVEVEKLVRDQDLSEDLAAAGELTFGFNAMEVRVGDRRRFGAILSIKEYKEASLDAINRFLQLPMEFVVTQCIDFINAEAALMQYHEQKRLAKLSEDEQLTRLSEVDHILGSDRKSAIDFGEQQLSVFVLADTVRILEKNVRQAMNFLHKNGVVVVREDLRLEQSYWAQLPGNFEFISRLSLTGTSHAAGFASLHNFPAGFASGNHWGPPVSTFHTAAGTPYFFNFHQGACGHTSIFGPFGSGKTVLTHFLLTQATKFQPKITYFDVNGGCQDFIEKLGGVHYRFTAEPSGDMFAVTPLNPFTLEWNEENAAFLSQWLGVLVRVMGGAPDEAARQAIRQAVEVVYGGPETERHFATFLNALADISPEMAAAFAPWGKEGEYGHLFSHTSDLFDAGDGVLCFDLKDVLAHPQIQVPLVSYLLRRTEQLLDGTPTILVMDEAWKLLHSTHVSAKLPEWLDRLSEANAMGIFTTEYVEEASREALSRILIDGMATQIFLPDDAPSDVYQSVFGLTDTEFSYLEVMDFRQRHFLLKRAGETVVAEMNLAGLDVMVDILSGKSAKREEVAEAPQEEASESDSSGQGMFQIE